MTVDTRAENFIQTVELDRIRVMVTHKISKLELRSLHDLDLCRYIDHLTQDVALQFRAFVLGEKQQPIKLGSVPRSWWQMFKRDVMPGWFVRRFPVLTREITIDATVFYPDLKISVPQNQSRVIVHFHPRPL